MLKKDAQYNGHLTSFAKLPPQLASFLSYSLCTKTLTCQINVPRYSFLLSLKIFWGFLLPKNCKNIFLYRKFSRVCSYFLTLFWKVWQEVLLIQKLRNFRKKNSPNSLKLRVESLEQGLSQSFYKSINRTKIWKAICWKFEMYFSMSLLFRFFTRVVFAQQVWGDRFLGMVKNTKLGLSKFFWCRYNPMYTKTEEALKWTCNLFPYSYRKSPFQPLCLRF